jgi:site-specific DNA recombinase
VLRLVHPGSHLSQPPSASLVSLLVQAHRWWAELKKRELDVTALACREGMTGSYLTRVLRLAFLSPTITQAILTGRQAVGWTCAH